jgi:hypothetical protein
MPKTISVQIITPITGSTRPGESPLSSAASRSVIAAYRKKAMRPATRP